MSISNRQCQSAIVSVNQRIANLNRQSSMSINNRQSQSAIVNVNQQSPISINIRQSQSTIANLNQQSPISINNRQSQSTIANLKIRNHQSAVRNSSLPFEPDVVDRLDRAVCPPDLPLLPELVAELVDPLLR